MRCATIALALAVAVPLATAQEAQFEVVSVKLHTSDDQRTFMVAQPGGRFVAANIPLRMLIRSAYQLQEDQIFTALQEQLGLKLTAARDTVEVLVIDTLEPPTPN